MTDARRWGVQSEYHDASGRLVEAAPDTVAAVLAALGAGDGGEPPPPGALILHPGDGVDQPLEVITEDGRALRARGSRRRRRAARVPPLATPRAAAR